MPLSRTQQSVSMVFLTTFVFEWKFCMGGFPGIQSLKDVMGLFSFPQRYRDVEGGRGSVLLSESEFIGEIPN